MVIKGGARSGPGELACHLLRADTNEFVEVRSLDWVTAQGLREALFEISAMGEGARSRRPLYHASINTPVWEALTDEQKTTSIDRLGRRLGLADQPRVVVEHIKEGRQHLHVVWLRIDPETATAIPDSHNYRKHEEVARELEREFGHDRVQGAHHEREGVERPVRRPSLAETRQAERSGLTPEDARTQLRELWSTADTGQAFAAALDDTGWILARGDKRSFVVLDPTGEVRAINKDITGLSAAKVRERLADLDANRLPSVEDARERQRNRRQSVGREQVREALSPVPNVEAVSASADTPSQSQKVAPSQVETLSVIPELLTQPVSTAPLAAVMADAVELKAAEQNRFAGREGVSATLNKLNDGARDIPSLVGKPETVAVPPQEQQPRSPDVSRLRSAIDSARGRLDALGERLEQAFARIRKTLERAVCNEGVPADLPAARAELAQRSADIAGSAALRRTLDRYRQSRWREPEGRD